MEMAVRADYKIRHSEFLKWSADDRDKAIAQHVRSRTACDRCGTRAEEWDEERGGHRRAYYAVETRCLGCEQIEAKRDSLPSDIGRGIRIALRRNEGV